MRTSPGGSDLTQTVSHRADMPISHPTFLIMFNSDETDECATDYPTPTSNYPSSLPTSYHEPPMSDYTNLNVLCDNSEHGVPATIIYMQEMVKETENYLWDDKEYQ